MASDVKHDYHLVNPSPWPFVGSLGAFVAAVGAVLWMNGSYNFGGLQGQPWVMTLGLALIAYTMYGWWRDVTRESLGGDHTPVVKLHLRYGMVLFIASEVMFFVAWFWAFFNVALYPETHHMTSWPPEGIVTFDPWHLPLINTVVLLTSGMTVTWAHHAATEGDTPQVVQGLFLTVILGVLFTALQAYEYSHAAFTFGFQGADLQPLEGAALEVLANPVGDVTAIYGSTFYMATGFHGFHVVIGTIFLAVCLVRAMRNHFTAQSHFGLEAAAWYWHFVDVVWLFLFAAIYVWAAGPNPGGAH